MSSKEVTDFLSDSNIARIATVKPNGSPHVTPVWYLWEENHLFIVMGKNSVKARNIRKNNRVAVTIDDDHQVGNNSRGIIIEGTAKTLELTEEIRRKMYQRYVSPKDLEKYLDYARSNYNSIVLHIHPEKIISFDYSKNPVLSKLQFKTSAYKKQGES